MGGGARPDFQAVNFQHSPFLVPTGRGRPEDGVSAQDYEEILNDLYDLSWHVSFGIKTTEAPHYRRVVQERARGIRWDGRAGAAGNDGNGFVFVDHIGDITPSGFLPLRAGNIRTDSLVEVYRNHALFRELRDPERLRGRCGVCRYRVACGGSRSRAYAMTGDHLGEDPCCLYEPSKDGLVVRTDSAGSVGRCG